MTERKLPVGKLPVDLLAKLLAEAPGEDPRVLQGPGVGLDCAVLDFGPLLLVLKSDPITFATDEIGWYAVQINANDIATTGAVPRWWITTLLLPEVRSTARLAEQITRQVYAACQELDIAVIGGHTEVTFGLDRPILVGTLIGEVERQLLVKPSGANPGDKVLLTKGVPIEATAVLAREFPERLTEVLDAGELKQAQDYIYKPGISVTQDARIALRSGRVTSMHDPTEGGLATALWELAEAGGDTLFFNPANVPIPSLANRVCHAFGLDPLASIASGALLLTTPPEDARQIRRALEAEGISCAEIGRVEAGPAAVWQETSTGREPLIRPERDEIAKVFET